MQRRHLFASAGAALAVLVAAPAVFPSEAWAAWPERPIQLRGAVLPRLLSLGQLDLQLLPPRRQPFALGRLPLGHGTDVPLLLRRLELRLGHGLRAAHPIVLFLRHHRPRQI